MTGSTTTSRVTFEELQPGDVVDITHQVKVGLRVWTVTTHGTLLRKERRRHGLHYRRNGDDKVFSDLLVLELAGGELTTVTLDEFTELRRSG